MPLRTATKGRLAAKRCALAISSATKAWLFRKSSMPIAVIFLVASFFTFPIKQSLSFVLSNTQERQEREEIARGPDGRFWGYFPSLFEGSRDENFKLKFAVDQFYRSRSDKVLYSPGTSGFPVRTHISQIGSQGVPLGDGYQFWESFSLRAHPFENLSFDAKANAGWREGEDSWTHVEKAFLETRWNSFVFAVGRKPLYWGQSFVSPILLGEHAQNLDLIEISTLPVRWFSWSEWKAQLFLSKMDSARVPSQDYFFGWRLGSQFFSRFEWNVGLIYQFKGEGMPSGSFKTYLLEFLGTRSAKPQEGEPQAGGNSDVTNRAMAVDMRLKMEDFSIPFHIYTEQHLEDCCGSIPTIYRKSYNYIYGLSLLLDENWNLGSWDVEWVRTATALYYHHRWKSGLSNRGQLMGHPLGPDARGLYLRWRKNGWQTNLAWEERRITGNITETMEFKRFYSPYESPETSLSGSMSKPWVLREGLEIEAGVLVQRVWQQNYVAKNAWEMAVFAGLELSLASRTGT